MRKRAIPRTTSFWAVTTFGWWRVRYERALSWSPHHEIFVGDDVELLGSDIRYWAKQEDTARTLYEENFLGLSLATHEEFDLSIYEEEAA